MMYNKETEVRHSMAIVLGNASLGYINKDICDIVHKEYVAENVPAQLTDKFKTIYNKLF